MEASNENVVFVGTKDIMRYVYSLQTQARDFNEIWIKARGKQAIGSAVHLSQVAINRFLKEWKVGNIILGTQERKISKEVTQRVSTIEIQLLQK